MTTSRVDALLRAVRDIAPKNHPNPTLFQAASTAHREVFSRYVTALRASHKEAMEWWEGRIEGTMEDSGEDRAAAERAQLQSIPAGPASHDWVVGTIRQFWLECSKVNGTIPPDQRAAPEQVVLGWLAESADDDLRGLAEFISTLPYMPVGLNQEGVWV